MYCIWLSQYSQTCRPTYNICKPESFIYISIYQDFLQKLTDLILSGSHSHIVKEFSENVGLPTLRKRETTIYVHRKACAQMAPGGQIVRAQARNHRVVPQGMSQTTYGTFAACSAKKINELLKYTITCANFKGSMQSEKKKSMYMTTRLHTARFHLYNILEITKL